MSGVLNAVISDIARPVLQANFLTSTALPSWAALARASHATVVDSAGYTTFAPNQLFLNSASGLAVSGTQNITVPAGARNYILYGVSASGTGVLTASGAGYGSGAAVTCGVGGTSGVIVSSAAGGTITITCTVATVSNVKFSLVGRETSLRSVDNVETTGSAYYGPRFDYSLSSVGTARGLLIEPASTQLAGATGNFDTTSYWAAYNGTRTTDSTLTSDGYTAYALFTADSTNDTHCLYNVSKLTMTNGAVYTWSTEVKVGNTNFVWINMASAVSKYLTAVFNIGGTSDIDATQTAAVGATLVSARAVYLGSGRFRLSLTGSIATPTTGVYIQVGIAGAESGNTLDTAGNPTSNAINGKTAYFGLCQWEQVRYPTSYMPNTATSGTVARVADVVTLSGAAVTALQGAAGAAIVQFNLAGDLASDPQHILVDNSNGLLYLDASRVVKTTNGTTVLSSTQTAAVGTTGRAGVTWNASGRSISYSNSTAASDANTRGSNGTIYLGNNNGATSAVGRYHGIGIYDRKLSDNGLKTRTTVDGGY